MMAPPLSVKLMFFCNELEIEQGIEIDQPVNRIRPTVAEQVCLVYEIAAFKIREDACEIGPGYFRFRADFCSCQTGFVVGQSPDDLHVRFRTGKYGVVKLVELHLQCTGIRETQAVNVLGKALLRFKHFEIERDPSGKHVPLQYLVSVPMD